MSTSRLKLKLLNAGYSDEDIESLDRSTCMEMWAELVTRGVDQPLPATPQHAVYDVELERERLKWEQQKHEAEMRLKERELALKEDELQISRKLKEDELELQKQQFRSILELENTLSMKTKRFSDALKGTLIKMSSDPVEVASFFRQVDTLYEKFEVPQNLRATLVKPYLNDKAKLVVYQLDPTLADDYKLLKEAILREFKTTPSYLLNKFQTMAKDSSETYILYGSKLMTILNYYLDSRNIDTDFAKLLELLVCDRVKAVLDDACLKHILTIENSADDGWLRLTELTTAIDKYYANCIGGQKKTPVISQNQMSFPMRHGNQAFTSRGGSSGAFTDKSPRNPVGFGSKPPLSTVRRCFECDSHNHTRAYCPHVRANSNLAAQCNIKIISQSHKLKNLLVLIHSHQNLCDVLSPNK